MLMNIARRIRIAVGFMVAAAAPADPHDPTVIRVGHGRAGAQGPAVRRRQLGQRRPGASRHHAIGCGKIDSDSGYTNSVGYIEFTFTGLEDGDQAHVTVTPSGDDPDDSHAHVRVHDDGRDGDLLGPWTPDQTRPVETGGTTRRRTSSSASTASGWSGTAVRRQPSSRRYHPPAGTEVNAPFTRRDSSQDGASGTCQRPGAAVLNRPPPARGRCPGRLVLLDLPHQGVPVHPEHVGSARHVSRAPRSWPDVPPPLPTPTTSA